MAFGPTKGISKDASSPGAVAQFVIMTNGADDDNYIPASADNQPLVGIAQNVLSAADAAAGKTVEVMVTGISYLILGVGGCERGNKITSDANGNGVVAVAGNQAIGIAMASGVQGDQIPVLLAQATA